MGNVEYIVETNNLTKKFGEKLAVDQINMHIKKGEIYGFIGKNGAGKTTTMKLLLGLIFPTKGEIKMFGSTDLNAARQKIGSLIEEPGLYKNFSAFENMKRFAKIYGGSEDEIRNILELVGLGNVGKRPAGKFSLGMRQRLGIGIALLGNPEMLILDEPINGLDPEGIKEVRNTILKLNQERKITILISSHLLDELDRITTTYGIVNDGQLVEEIDAQELKKRCRQNLRIITDQNEKAIKLIQSQPEYREVHCSIENEEIKIFSEISAPEVLNELLVTNGVKVRELSFSKDGFEEYFIERIGR